MTPEFSFEQDVAPYASRFFGEIGNDRRLSGAARNQIQGRLLGGLSEIRSQRAELEDQATRGRINRLREIDAVSSLEEAQAKRRRIEMESQKVDGTEKLVRGILDSGASAEEKEAALGEVDVGNARVDDPAIRRITEAARKSLPSSRDTGFTPGQVAALAESVPPEILATGDPVLIGQYQGELARQNAEFEEKRKQVAADKKEREKLLDEDFDFDDPAPDDPEGVRKWMTPKSTQVATLIVDQFGTPEEQKRFDELRTAASDIERERLVRSIQTRKLREKYRSATGTETKAEKAKSLIFGK
jgi:hypothetical protein